MPWDKLSVYLACMEPSYIISRIRGMTVPELLDAIADAKAGKPFDIYDQLEPDLIDRTTDALADFIEAVEALNK